MPKITLYHAFFLASKNKAEAVEVKPPLEVFDGPLDHQKDSENKILNDFREQNTSQQDTVLVDFFDTEQNEDTLNTETKENIENLQF